MSSDEQPREPAHGAGGNEGADTNSPGALAGAVPPPASALFDGVEVLSPLDELREVLGRHQRGFGGAPDRDREEQLVRAHELARQHLLKALAAETEGHAAIARSEGDAPESR